MRRKTSSNDDLLEPLSVWDDGVAVEPAMASDDPSVDRALVRDCVDAVLTVLGERADTRAQPPWTSLQAPPRVVRSTTSQSTFSRMICVGRSQLGSLPDWWRRNTAGGRVRVTRRLSLGEPRLTTSGVWLTPGRLRSRWLLRAIPVELLLWPHLDSWTKVLLEPQRPTHVGRRYFRRGHEVLDALGARLVNELEPH
jgi:hypothetical protein